MRLALLVAVSLVACGAGMTGYDPSRYRHDDQAGPGLVDPEIAPIPRGAKRWMLDPRQPVDAGDD